MPIYTRTGDEGSTSLFGGKRVPKCHELVEVYGSLDELNSWIGYIDAVITSPDGSEFLRDLQSDVFAIGAFLAGSGTVSPAQLPGRSRSMEERIDAMEAQLPELHNFILPGGSPTAAGIHIARSICRRVERQVVALQKKRVAESDPSAETGMDKIIPYLNRLSDFLFTLARFMNHKEGKVEVVWSGNDRKEQKT